VTQSWHNHNVAEESLFSMASLSNQKPAKARILRGGAGVLSPATAWAAGDKLDLSERKLIQLTRGDFSFSPAVRPSWAPSEFTNLAGMEQGKELHEFRLVTHGFELKDLVPGFEAAGSFDDFVHKYFKVAVPIGLDFLRVYPSCFFKKTIVAASVVSHTNTATFGTCGLLLCVPVNNYVASSPRDMHSPLDQAFYGNVPTFQPNALVDMKPAELEKKLDLLKKMGMPRRQLRRIRAEAKGQSRGLLSGSASLELDRLTFEHPLVRPAELLSAYSASYNEVALVPTLGSHEVKISGFFFRADPTCDVLATDEGKIVAKVAETYDLPIVHIYDGQHYDTNEFVFADYKMM